MARTVKKETALTSEEKLAQALVPEAEQPYQVESNWCWSKFSSIIELISGRDAALSDCNDEGIGIPYILGASNLDNNSFTVERWIEKPQVVAEKGDILLSVKGTIGKLYIQQEEKINLSRQIMAIRSSSVVNKHYVYIFLLSICEELREEGSGLIPGISRQDILNRAFPLPPLAEQQRIVDRIESLFAKLDEAKEKAQAVVDGFENRKAAILHKAFTGELTAVWRKQRGISYTSWKQLTVKDACIDVKVGIVIKPSQYYTDENSGTAAFRSANVREFHVDDFDWVYLNETGMSTNQRSVVHTGDVLVVRSGNPGTACVVDERFDGYNAIDILIAVPNKAIITPDYLCAFTNSPMGRNLVAESKRGMALAHFNVSGYSKLELSLPTIEEQKEITSILFALLEKEQQAKEAAEQVIDQIDTIKKAILSRAFRGELGTNDPNDESAEELLKRVL